MSQIAILIIEDDVDLGEVVSFVLQEAGFTTELIRDGSAALKRMNDEVPSLVMLDMHLPGASGLEILNYIRSDSRLMHTRVLVTTADPLMAKAAADRADLIFTKPYSVGDLIDSVTRLSV